MTERRDLPWSETCFVCGDSNPLGLQARFAVEDKYVRLDTTLDPRYEGYPGHVHGGIITALLDETVGWACSVGVGRMFFTVELTVRFTKPVPGGAPLSVFGELTDQSSKLAKGRGWIENGVGVVLATAEGVFFPLPRDDNDFVIRHLKMGGRAAVPNDIHRDHDEEYG